jgi:hypothetical protein
VLIVMWTGKTAGKSSDGSKDAILNRTRGHACYILAKNLFTFCPCPRLCGRLFKVKG